MRFKLYRKGSVVAYAFDDRGTVGLRHLDGRSLLLTGDGIPRSVVERSDVAAVASVLVCIADDLDRDACASRGVEVSL